MHALGRFRLAVLCAVLAAARGHPAQTMVATGDGSLALDFELGGGRVRVLVRGAPLPQLPAPGGFSVADVTRPGEELLANGDLEADADGDGVPDGFIAGRGWVRDSDEAHGGRYSVRCHLPGPEDGTSGDFGVTVPVQGGRTYLVSFWLKCRGRAGRYPASTGYIQQQDDAGRRTTEVFQHTMPAGVAGGQDWTRTELLLTTEPATRKLFVRTNIYRGYGTLWADDFSVREAGLDPEPLPTEVSPRPGGALLRGTDPERSLRIEAAWEAAEGMLRLSGSVSDTSGRDRCLVVSYCLPLDAIGGLWGSDIASALTIPPAGRCARVESWGRFGPFSVYPFSSVVLPDRSAALSLAVPMDQAQPFRLVYDGRRGLLVEWVLALTPVTARFPGSAPFSAVLYSHDPAWGFRAAAERYYRLFPESFAVRCPKQGNWYYHDLGKLQNPEDFGLRFNELTTPATIAEDDRRGCLTFAYTEPWGWWGWAVGLRPGESEKPAPKQDVLRHIRSLAEGCPPDADRRRQSPCLAAQTILNSGVFDAAGEYTTAGYVARWGGYNWALNPAPGAVPPGQFSRFEATCLWEIEPKLAMGADGIYLDSIVNSWTAIPNYRPEHLARAGSPLTFSLVERRPAQLGLWNQHEFVAHLSRDLHARGKLLMANIFPYNWVFFNHWLDVLGHEVGWSMESAEKMRACRTLAYHKPYAWLLVLKPEVPAETREVWMRQAMSYGIFPNIVGGTQDTSLYERFRPLYRTYMPVILAMAEAGWEPIPEARSSVPAVCVERFGPRDGALFFSCRNDGDAAVSARVAVDWAALRLRPAAAATRLPEGDPLGTDDSGAFLVDIAPGGVTVLRCAATPP